MEKVICVDFNDQMIGECEKLEAHRIPVLHRAFSVFIVHEDKMLIHQRAFHKYHWGGYWTNACCSHPRANETLLEAVHRRLQEELGIDGDVEELFSFTYLAHFSDECSEYEYDHVFIMDSDITPEINPEEVHEFKWISIEDLQKDMLEYPKKYTPWFMIACPRVIQIMKARHV